MHPEDETPSQDTKQELVRLRTLVRTIFHNRRNDQQVMNGILDEQQVITRVLQGLSHRLDVAESDRKSRAESIQESARNRTAITVSLITSMTAIVTAVIAAVMASR